VNSLPLVSFITVNYNGLEDTVEFLKSVEKITYPNVEVIVVDNGSKIDPGTQLQTRFKFIEYIRSDTNLGFAGGNNLAIKVAKGDYLFFLNNDTILYPDFLEAIISFMESHEDAGMASPKVVFPDEKTIQYAGAIGISPFTGRGKRLGLGEVDHGQYDYCSPTDLGHGAALIVPRKVIELIGPMPEIYFLYYEEHDWCEQVKRANFRMYYLGNSKIIHKEAVGTGGQLTPIKVYYMTRSRLLFMRRNSSGVARVVGLLFFFLATFPKNLLQFVLKRKPELAKAFFKGAVWNSKAIFET
jgi:GT2 family glycosyltransferase